MQSNVYSDNWLKFIIITVFAKQHLNISVTRCVEGIRPMLKSYDC